MAKDKQHTKKELEALKGPDVFKIAERMKIAGFTKMDGPEIIEAILEAQGDGGADPAAEDLDDKKAAIEKAEAEKAAKAAAAAKKAKTPKTGETVRLRYTSKGGSVKLGGVRYSPGGTYVLPEAEAKALRAKFPERFQILKSE